MDLTAIGHALAGGALIGASAALLLVLNGRIAGVSGIVGGLVTKREEIGWRALFTLGLVAGGLVAYLIAPARFATGGSPDLVRIGIAGALVGVGTYFGSGCTSGHGVCGTSRLSPRSIVATITFIATGVVTVLAVRWIAGGLG